jgi:hypothetical protein
LRTYCGEVDIYAIELIISKQSTRRLATHMAQIWLKFCAAMARKPSDTRLSLAAGQSKAASAAVQSWKHVEDKISCSRHELIGE